MPDREYMPTPRTPLGHFPRPVRAVSIYGGECRRDYIRDCHSRLVNPLSPPFPYGQIGNFQKSGDNPSLICCRCSREAICSSWPCPGVTIPASINRRSVLEKVSLVKLS